MHVCATMVQRALQLQNAMHAYAAPRRDELTLLCLITISSLLTEDIRV